MEVYKMPKAQKWAYKDRTKERREDLNGLEVRGVEAFALDLIKSDLLDWQEPSATKRADAFACSSCWCGCSLWVCANQEQLQELTIKGGYILECFEVVGFALLAVFSHYKNGQRAYRVIY